ncbi:MAG: hypothetical protein IPO13_00920 [Rhodocyclaceae bacterium]|nr:hypothetical protein [Rhodocyclaceae bacterium]
MKIHQLPMGARFEYEGEEYVKTGSLFATGKGGQRLVPKYAVLKPLSGAECHPDATTDRVFNRANVLEAFDAFYSDCKILVPELHQVVIEKARDRFLSALEFRTDISGGVK